MVVVHQHLAAWVKRAGDALRPGVQVAQARDDAFGRVDEIEAPAAQLARQRLSLRLDPEDLRPLLAGGVEHRLGRVDRGDDRTLLGEVGARVARPALQMQHALRRQVAERRLDDRRQAGA